MVGEGRGAAPAEQKPTCAQTRDLSALAGGSGNDAARSKRGSGSSRKGKDGLPGAAGAASEGGKSGGGRGSGRGGKGAHKPAPKRRPEAASEDNGSEASPEGDGAAEVRAKDEVNAGIRGLLETNSVLQPSDFDARVRQHLHAFLNSGGKQRLIDALGTIREATVRKERSVVRNWPAYLLTLLKKADSDLAWKDREARARARIAAAAASGGSSLEVDGNNDEEVGNWWESGPDPLASPVTATAPEKKTFDELASPLQTPLSAPSSTAPDQPSFAIPALDPSPPPQLEPRSPLAASPLAASPPPLLDPSPPLQLEARSPLAASPLAARPPPLLDPAAWTVSGPLPAPATPAPRTPASPALQAAAMQSALQVPAPPPTPDALHPELSPQHAMEALLGPAPPTPQPTKQKEKQKGPKKQQPHLPTGEPPLDPAQMLLRQLQRGPQLAQPPPSPLGTTPTGIPADAPVMPPPAALSLSSVLLPPHPPQGPPGVDAGLRPPFAGGGVGADIAAVMGASMPASPFVPGGGFGVDGGFAPAGGGGGFKAVAAAAATRQAQLNGTGPKALAGPAVLNFPLEAWAAWLGQPQRAPVAASVTAR